MKIILLLSLFITLRSFGVSISQNRSNVDGHSQQEFRIENGKFLFLKNSNFFDQSKDYRLGTLVTNVRSAQNIQGRLTKLIKNIHNAEELLKKRGVHFNDLSSKDNHETYFLVDTYRITKNSSLYSSVEDLFKDARSMKWELSEGVIFSPDVKTKTTVRGGKVSSKEAFAFKFYCKAPRPPTVCSEKNVGILYVE